MNNLGTLHRFGEVVDRLITLDIRGRGESCPIVDRLYPSARKLYGKPLTSYAAERLKDVVGKGDTVLFITGLATFGVAPETDGPVGAVTLGRALQLGLGARPIFIVHELFTEMMSKTAIGGGFLPFSREQIKYAWSRVPSAAMIQGWPVDESKARTLAAEFFAEYSPKALVAIEARGPNQEGVYHIVTGEDATFFEAKMGTLLEEAIKNEILTIGINDGCGIEIGFGTISDAVLKEYPRYATCQCGCKSGMHDATKVDVVLPVSVSNWGANGIAACLAILLGNPDVLHNPEMESRVIRICADAGAMDGTTGRSAVGVDGLPEKTQMAIIEILNQIVRFASNEYLPGLRM
jgi:D-glutamate cyclase